VIAYTLAYTIPAAFAVLPARLDSPEARAMLLAIGLQESRFLHRHQVGGPAVSFWQFERAGVKGVLTHPASAGLVRTAYQALRYDTQVGSPGYALHVALEHNDVLACVFARLLLWTLPLPLPPRDEPELAWQQYLLAWRPGRPRRDSWDAYYGMAWLRVTP
jgi:hypothetical protein